jgi:hypothetical protein
MSSKPKNSAKKKAPPVAAATACSSSFDRWPLNVNPEMDRHAAMHGLPHWSCVSTKGNEWWIRKDGAQHEAFASGHYKGGYPEELRAFDVQSPMNSVLTQPDIAQHT